MSIGDIVNHADNPDRTVNRMAIITVTSNAGLKNKIKQKKNPKNDRELIIVLAMTKEFDFNSQPGKIFVNKNSTIKIAANKIVSFKAVLLYFLFNESSNY